MVNQTVFAVPNTRDHLSWYDTKGGPGAWDRGSLRLTAELAPDYSRQLHTRYTHTTQLYNIDLQPAGQAAGRDCRQENGEGPPTDGRVMRDTNAPEMG